MRTAAFFLLLPACGNPHLMPIEEGRDESRDEDAGDSDTTDTASDSALCVPDPVATLCAGQCGEIEVEEHCGLIHAVWCGECPCVPKPDLELCSESMCGSQLVIDNCGAERQIECAACPACYPETDVQLCSAQGAVCGSIAADDGCGAPRLVESCGACGWFQQCLSNQCEQCGFRPGSRAVRHTLSPCGMPDATAVRVTGFT